MTLPRIALVLGTRPEAIKLAPVALALKREGRADVRVCVTGQHREMVDGLLPLFGVKADADLQLMQPGQTLNGLASRAIAALGAWYETEKPSLVLVQGDTTTAFAAALAAYYSYKPSLMTTGGTPPPTYIPIAHVEAGLRSDDLSAPWPEEGNRRLISQLAALHFAPTETARANLERESITKGVHVVGNTGIDALLFAREKNRLSQPRVAALPDDLQPGATGRRMVLITGHRREHFGVGLENLCSAIRHLARSFADVAFVYAVHLNPNVRKPVEQLLRNGVPDNVILLEPVPYFEFVALMERSALILTDSGGIQEEAPSLGKPVIVFREKTERPEAVAAGTSVVVGPRKEAIVAACERVLDAPAQAPVSNPYGDGQSAPRIAKICSEYVSII